MGRVDLAVVDLQATGQLASEARSSSTDGRYRLRAHPALAVRWRTGEKGWTHAATGLGDLTGPEISARRAVSMRVI